MLANATCCRVHRNAVIRQGADDNVWIRVTADGRVGGGISLVSAVNGCRVGGLAPMFFLATTRLCGLRGRVFFGFLGISSLDSGWRALRLLGAGRSGGEVALVTVSVVIRCI